MQGLLTDIELDIRELKCLMDAFTREPNVALREVIRRNILQMRGRLDALLLDVDAIAPTNKEKVAEEAEALSPVTEQMAPIEPVVKPAVPAAGSNQPATIESIEEKSSIPPTPILAERIKTTTELSGSISLNDSFRFSRELFGGDAGQMNRVLQQIGEMSTYAAAVSFLSSKVNVSEDNETMADLLELLRKYFN